MMSLLDRMWLAIAIVGLLVTMWFHSISLTREIDHLTSELTAATVQLEKEIERGKRVEEIAARIEQGEEARQKQLRRFERSLSDLSAADTELRNVLRTVVPPAALRGLRSYNDGGSNTTVDGVSGSR